VPKSAAESSGAVLGYDVGWSLVRASSAACLLEWDARSVRLAVRRFTARPDDVRTGLTPLVGGRALRAAAFDGPLNCALDEIGIYRASERILTLGLARHIGKPGQCNAPNGRLLNGAANAAAQAVLALGGLAAASHQAAIHERAIAEAFPTSFLGMLLEAADTGRVGSAARSDLYYARAVAGARGGRLGGLIRALLPGRRVVPPLAGFANHDDRAAVVCAVTALCIALGRYVAVGDATHGFVMLPPPASRVGAPGLQPWAMALLRANAGASAMVIAGP
jgi:hypothetical protein